MFTMQLSRSHSGNYGLSTQQQILEQMTRQATDNISSATGWRLILDRREEKTCYRHSWTGRNQVQAWQTVGGRRRR